VLAVLKEFVKINGRKDGILMTKRIFLTF